MCLLSFKDIINYEMYDNNTQSMSGSSYEWGKKRRLTTYESKTVETCKDLRLIIRLKNAQTFQVTYDLVNTFCNFGITKTSSIYNSCISSIQNAISFLEVLVAENKEITK